MSEEGKSSKRPSGNEIYNFRKNNPYLSWKDVGIHYKKPWATVKSREYRYRKDNNILSLSDSR